MFEADGTWTPLQMATGIGIASANLFAWQTNITILTNYGYSITSLGNFNSAGTITVKGDEMLNYDTGKYYITEPTNQEDWGILKTIIGGGYTGTSSDIWNLSTYVDLTW